MSAFRTAIAAQAAKIRDYAGVSVVYARGNDSVTITNAIKFPPRKRAPFDQVAIDLTAQDWGIAVEDLILSAAEITPARGDTITFDGTTYEVLPDQGDSVAHKTAADTQWRIHTKET